jgi:ATP-dependent DNA helicase RecQ
VALGLLQEMGCLHWPDPFHFQVLHRRWQPPPRQDPWRGMDDLIHSRGCRWQVILRHFGYPENQPGLPCGTCDRCRAAQRR